LLMAGGLMFCSTAKAVCPLCVVAVGAGLGLSRWLGVDDVISSMWIGALLASLSIWTITWLKKKNWSFKYDKIAVWAAYYLLALGPLYYSEIIGHPLNRIFGIDKILFGAIFGTIVFLLSLELHKLLRKRNQGKSFFTFQRIAVSAAALLIASIIIYFLLKWI
ncbi:MAG: hypothetical protein ABH835_03655, partial [Patescibacteria group bacterium]